MHGRRVLVAGGGLAGLAAAHELATAGAAVTIMDARGRLGGRVWTVRDGFLDAQYGELGGEFIDEEHRCMRQLAQAFGLDLVRVLRGGFTHRYQTADGDIRLSRTRPWEALSEVFAPLVRQYEAAGGAPGAAPVRALSACSVREWLHGKNAAPELHAMADALRGFFLADPDELSARPLVAQLASGKWPSQTHMYRIAGGNDRLVDALARASSARCLLRHRVRAITQASDRVIVRAEDEHDRLREVEADAAVIALPASTLRDVIIRPALPEIQERAIRRLRYGCATKAVVQCAGEGLASRRAQAFATGGELGAFWDSTGGQPARSPMLTFLAGGSMSAPLGDRARRGAALLEPLCWLGLGGGDVLRTQWVSWEDDPLAGGGYAFADPTFDSSWTPLLAQRAGRLVFAGEHTSQEWQGYMEGAVESGQRAARELTRQPFLRTMT